MVMSYRERKFLKGHFKRKVLFCSPKRANFYNFEGKDSLICSSNFLRPCFGILVCHFGTAARKKVEDDFFGRNSFLLKVYNFCTLKALHCWCANESRVKSD